jgi:UDP-glucose:(glucosyl)LPS alpha-1,2-glucosyltransferase
MNNNFDLMEINPNANGGTELFMRFLYSGVIPRALLENVQIIPGRITELKEDKIRILTLHDLPHEQEFQKLSDISFRKKLHKTVFISNWQQQQFANFLKFPYDNTNLVIESAILPCESHDKPPQGIDDVVNIAYFTTPHRGLHILLPAFQKLAETDKQIKLHVHSSFAAYGRPEQDAQFEPLFQVCRDHPQVEYYGFTDHDELLEKMKSYHIFAYPSIWPETACRAMLEAMSAKMLCVHPNLAALPDTSGSLNFMYQGSTNPQEHLNSFFGALGGGIGVVRENSQSLQDHLSFNKHYVDWRYNPQVVVSKWVALLTDLNKHYADVASRKVSTDQIWVMDTNVRG